MAYADAATGTWYRPGATPRNQSLSPTRLVLLVLTQRLLALILAGSRDQCRLAFHPYATGWLRRNQFRKPSFAVRIVPGMRLFGFDFAVAHPVLCLGLTPDTIVHSTVVKSHGCEESLL